MIPGAVTVGFLHPSSYSACFAESKQELFFYDATHEQRLVSHRWGQLGKECGSGGIVAGRNKLAATVLDESESEWLFMVDSDMGFAPDTVERLIAAADPDVRPVVGGLCFAQQTDGRKEFFGFRYLTQPTLYRFVDSDEQTGFVPMFDYARDTLVQVDGTGGACVLIHRAALEKVRGRFGDHWFDPATHPKGNVFSEDLSFCIRLGMTDIPIWVHTGVRTTHDKHGVYLDEELYDLQQADRAVRLAAAS